MVFNHLKKMHSFLSNNKETLQKESDLDSMLDLVPDKAAEKQKTTKPAADKPAKTKAVKEKPAKEKPIKEKPVKEKPAKAKQAKPQPAKPESAKPTPAVNNSPVVTTTGPIADPDEANFQEMFGSETPSTNISSQQPPAQSAKKPASKAKGSKKQPMGATGGFKEDVPKQEVRPAAATKPAESRPQPPAPVAAQKPSALKVDASTYRFAIPASKTPGVFSMPQKKDQQKPEFSSEGRANKFVNPNHIHLPTNMDEYLNEDELEQWKTKFEDNIKNHKKLPPALKRRIIKDLHDTYGPPKSQQQSSQPTTPAASSPAIPETPQTPKNESNSIGKKFKQFFERWRSTPRTGAVSSENTTNKSFLTKSDDLENLMSMLDDVPQKDNASPAPAAQAKPTPRPSQAPAPQTKVGSAKQKPEAAPELSGMRINYEQNHPKYMVQHLIERTIKTSGKDVPSTRRLALKNARSSLIQFAENFPEHTEDLINKINQFLQPPGSQKPETPDTHEVVAELQGMLGTAKSKKIEQKPLEFFKPEIFSRIKSEEDRIKAEGSAKKIKAQNKPKQGFGDFRWASATSPYAAVEGDGMGVTNIELQDVDPEESDSSESQTPQREIASFYGLHDKSGIAKVAADIFLESHGINRAASEARASENLTGLKTGATRGIEHASHEPKNTRFTPPESPNLFTSAETVTTPSEVPPAPGSTRKFKDVVNIPSQHYKQYMGQQKTSSSDQDWRAVRSRHLQLKNQFEAGAQELENNSSNADKEKAK